MSVVADIMNLGRNPRSGAVGVFQFVKIMTGSDFCHSNARREWVESPS